MKNIQPNCFSCSYINFSEVIKIFVQFHRLSSYQTDLYPNDFVFKQTVTFMRLWSTVAVLHYESDCCETILLVIKP